MTTPTRPVSTGPMKHRASGELRKLAADMADAYPEMAVHQHLRDAARELDAGRTHSAQRHVHAAIFGLQPLQLRRHGVTDDAGHMRGKAMMQQAHRHLLLIKDIEDVKGNNDGLRTARREDREQQAQDKAARKEEPPQPPASIAASWEDVATAIELAATPVHETMAGRRALQKQGKTAYGTSYPMPNASYVRKALKAVGRVAPGKRGVLKRAIQKNAKRFGVSLKGTWAEGGSKNMGSEFNLAAYGIEDHFVHELAIYRYKHGWIKLNKGTVGAGTPPHPTHAEAMASRQADAGKAAAAMGRNRAHAVAKEIRREQAEAGGLTGKAKARYTELRRRGASHGRAMGILKRIGHSLEGGAEVMGGGYPASHGKLGQAFQVGSAAEAIESGAGSTGKALADIFGSTSGPKHAPKVARGSQPFGAHASKSEARGLAEMFGWHPKQKNAYAKARKAGHSHSKAAKIARAVGRSLDAGSATESILNYANPGPPPFRAWDAVCGAIELASIEPRIGAGSAGGGQWTVSGGGASKKQQAAPAHPTAAQAKRAQLNQQIRAYRMRVAALRGVLSQLQHHQITAVAATLAATKAGQIGLTPSAKKSASSTPAKKGAAAISAKAKTAAKKPAKPAGPLTVASESAAINKQISGYSKSIASLVKQVAALANENGEVIELRFDPAQLRDRRGRWVNAPGGMDTPNMRLALNAGFGKALGVSQEKERRDRFNYEGRPGDMGHIRAIMTAGDQMQAVSPTAANALHNAGRALAERDMKAVRVHLSVAEQETRGTGSHVIVTGIGRSMKGVPKGTYERLPYGRGLAPRDIGPGQPGRRHGPGYYPPIGRSSTEAYPFLTKKQMRARASVLQASWEDVDHAVELSARTGVLSVTPAPRGKPGGPGLYDIKGEGHTPYLQQIVKALIEKRGMAPGKAYAIARAAIRRWSAGGGHVHPEVRAAAGKAEAGELAKQAKAKLTHQHANAALCPSCWSGSPPAPLRPGRSGWPTPAGCMKSGTSPASGRTARRCPASRARSGTATRASSWATTRWCRRWSPPTIARRSVSRAASTGPVRPETR